jgi:hypothetical protein
MGLSAGRGVLNMNPKKITNKWLAENYFSKHEITTHEIFGSDLGRLEYMRWQEPGTWNCGIDYMARCGNLYVSGDLGEAIYCWYAKALSLEWIAGLNLDYFHGKTSASELGRMLENYEWDSDLARKKIFQYFKMERNCKGYKKFKDETRHSDLFDGKFQFHAWINRRHNLVYDLFGPDYWEFLYNMGRYIPLRTRLHLLGLAMAFNKFTPKGIM